MSICRAWQKGSESCLEWKAQTHQNQRTVPDESPGFLCGVAAAKICVQSPGCQPSERSERPAPITGKMRPTPRGCHPCQDLVNLNLNLLGAGVDRSWDWKSSRVQNALRKAAGESDGMLRNPGRMRASGQSLMRVLATCPGSLWPGKDARSRLHFKSSTASASEQATDSDRQRLPSVSPRCHT